MATRRAPAAPQMTAPGKPTGCPQSELGAVEVRSRRLAAIAAPQVLQKNAGLVRVCARFLRGLRVCTNRNSTLASQHISCLPAGASPEMAAIEGAVQTY